MTNMFILNELLVCLLTCIMWAYFSDHAFKLFAEINAKDTHLLVWNYLNILLKKKYWYRLISVLKYTSFMFISEMYNVSEHIYKFQSFICKQFHLMS